MNQQTDTDATGPFAVGTGRSDQSTDISSIQPNWIADGYGVRGPQKPVQQEQAEPHPMQLGPFANRQASDAPQTRACTPTARDPEETGTWIWGSVDGVCQWIDTTDCSTSL